MLGSCLPSSSARASRCRSIRSLRRSISMSTNDQLASAVRNDAATSADPVVATGQATLIEPARPPAVWCGARPRRQVDLASFGALLRDGRRHFARVRRARLRRCAIFHRAVRALGAEVNLEKRPDGSLAGDIRGWGGLGPSQRRAPSIAAIPARRFACSWACSRHGTSLSSLQATTPFAVVRCAGLRPRSS